MSSSVNPKGVLREGGKSALKWKGHWKISTFPKPFVLHEDLIIQKKAMLRHPARRLAIVEPVFANICVQKQLDRFTLRTKAKVDV
jgi:hypothetical protein